VRLKTNSRPALVHFLCFPGYSRMLDTGYFINNRNLFSLGLWAWQVQSMAPTLTRLARSALCCFSSHQKAKGLSGERKLDSLLLTPRSGGKLSRGRRRKASIHPWGLHPMTQRPRQVPLLPLLPPQCPNTGTTAHLQALSEVTITLMTNPGTWPGKKTRDQHHR
jgi:hypothetical protein